MDKETVLNIIKMLDKKIKTLEGWHYASLDDEDYDNRYMRQTEILTELKFELKTNSIILLEDKELGL